MTGRRAPDNRTTGERSTDVIAGFAGSWTFVWLHVVWFVVWLVFHFDINLLTLIVSLEAIFLATFILMAQNRQEDKDRTRDDREAEQVEQDTEQIQLLHSINKEQLEILQQQSTILEQLQEQHAHTQTTDGETTGE